MLCAKCNYDNPADALFCMKCGTKVENRCVSCNTANPADANFCRKCGGALGAAAPTSSPSSNAAAKTPRVEVREERHPPEGLDGERKTVTALFADIKGSTELMEDLDPEEARAIIDPALKLMIEAVRRYDGYVVQSTGDGIFALFGAPVAHEDHPQRALYAALRMQEELERYSAKVVADGSSPIQGRVGINTGEVVVRSITTGADQTEYTPIGHTTNLASRMQTAAPVGSIAVSENTRRLCEGYFILKPLGATKVKGLSEPVNVYEVTGLGPLRTRLQRAAGRGLTKFVGREREMDALKHAAEQANAERGQIVATMAEPGVGKSRLFFEFKATSHSGWMVLEAFSVSHGKASAYLPVIDLLRNYFRIANEDDERTRREKVAGKITILDRNLEDTLPYLFSLLGIVEGDDPLVQMDGQIKKRRTLEAIKRIALRESLHQSLMLIFEDLHWIDEATQELLNLLADSIGTAKILLLVNYRPEYSHQWGNKTYYTQLRLDPLGEESADAMLNALLGDDPGLAALKRLVTEKTQGNPFFIEEMVQNLFEEGALASNGEIKLTRPLSGIRIPTTVQAMLTARIDRLPADEKDLLQTLAVLGREFPLALVAHLLSTSDDELSRMLSDLQLGEFIYEQPAAGGIEYIFKHALTQEVAYNSILVERRKQIHERAAQATESLFEASLADHYTDLAHHYGRSGNALKAANYLHLAARQAMNRTAYEEARGQLTAALDLLQRQPEDLTRDRTEIAVRLSLANCLWVSVSYSASEGAEILERARELCEKVGDDVCRFETLAALAGHYSERLEHQKARRLFEELLGAATRMRDSEMEGRTRAGLGYSSMREGNFVAAMEEFELADELSANTSSRGETAVWNWRVQSRSVAAFTLCLLGYPDRARVRSRESFTMVREVGGSRFDVANALMWSVYASVYRKEPRIALSNLNEVTKLSDEHGFKWVLAFAHLWRGWALAQLGQTEEGLSEIVRSRAEFLQAAVAPQWYLWGFADVCLAAGRWGEGLEAANEGLNAIEFTQTRIIESDMRRLKGEFLLRAARSLPVEAAESYREAIEVARRQSAKSLELRATMSLARLLCVTGNRDEARSMLAGIYNWFTEGFDTADLKDAKALLDQLND